MRVNATGFVLMGWLIVVLMKPLLARVPAPGFALLLAGGITYTAGTVFYMLKRVRYMHAVWHLFVLAAAFATS